MDVSKNDLKLEYRPFRTTDVAAIDHLIKLTKGMQVVEGDRGWAIVGKVFEWWTRRWPNEWVEYVDSMEAIKQTRRSKDGLSKSKEVKYVGALPYRFERILRILFPLQQFDKEFVYKLTNKIKITKVGEKTDTWFIV